MLKFFNAHPQKLISFFVSETLRLRSVLNGPLRNSFMIPEDFAGLRKYGFSSKIKQFLRKCKISKFGKCLISKHFGSDICLFFGCAKCSKVLRQKDSRLNLLHIKISRKALELLKSRKQHRTFEWA